MRPARRLRPHGDDLRVLQYQVAFAAGLMYLAQMRRLKSKRPARFGFSLPSLEQSERVNRGAITIAFPLLTFGLLIGMIRID